MSKRVISFSLTDEALKFFTEYGDGNRSKGAERAAADLEDKPRPEIVRDETADAAAQEWEWILGLEDNDRMHAAREYPPRVITAIRGRPKSAYLSKGLAALKRVAELAIEAHSAHRELMAGAFDGFPIPDDIHMPAYLLEQYEEDHGHPLPRLLIMPIIPPGDAGDPPSESEGEKEANEAATMNKEFDEHEGTSDPLS